MNVAESFSARGNEFPTKRSRRRKFVRRKPTGRSSGTHFSEGVVNCSATDPGIDRTAEISKTTDFAPLVQVGTGYDEIAENLIQQIQKKGLPAGIMTGDAKHLLASFISLISPGVDAATAALGNIDDDNVWESEDSVKDSTDTDFKQVRRARGVPFDNWEKRNKGEYTRDTLEERRGSHLSKKSERELLESGYSPNTGMNSHVLKQDVKGSTNELPTHWRVKNGLNRDSLVEPILQSAPSVEATSGRTITEHLAQPSPHAVNNFPLTLQPQAKLQSYLSYDEDKTLSKRLEQLQTELVDTKLANFRLQATISKENNLSSWLILHLVKCPDHHGWAKFQDEPELVINDWNISDQQHKWHWDARSRLSEKRVQQLERDSSPFIVYREYECVSVRKMADSSREDDPGHNFQSTNRDGHSSRSTNRSCEGGTTTVPKPNSKHRLAEERGLHTAIGESVYIVSETLRQRLIELRERVSDLRAYERGLDLENWRFYSPYYFFFHFKDEIEQYTTTINNSKGLGREDLLLFIDYLTTKTYEAHTEAKNALEQGSISVSLVPYLFKPGGLLLTFEEGQPVCRTLVSELIGSAIEPAGAYRTNTPTTKVNGYFRFSLSYFVYNGQFRLVQEERTFSFSEDQSRPQMIADLPYYPLIHAPKELREFILSRGRTFFNYCCKHYVTYLTIDPLPTFTEERVDDQYQTQARYMIDGEAFRMIHEDEQSEKEKAFGEAEIVSPTPQDEKFLCQLPAYVNGYHMTNKKWSRHEVRLLVENVRPVPWNKAAFDSLALAPGTKELVKALITHKIGAAESVDFVQGKGNGLIILLHGGPGTGKTLTAESVAEIAERPLYRVSCGDVGTDPGDVESYLTSVFYLGRRWGSVVLLDEADVFLEERSLDNLQRNALVSVFLRMIEYYDGILVLTSNRVGILDEAFKSRIQLSLYYPDLETDQRCQIWNNFLDRLEMLREKMDIQEIRHRIAELAAYKINGRQIRNAVTSARELARYYDRELRFEDLKQVLDVAHQFESYMRKVKGVSAEKWAREKMER